MAEKKISFSLKPANKPKVVQPIGKPDKTKEQNGVELIQCFEDRSIRLVKLV